ncbi:ABC transporter substrate-binding protein [Hoeflea prorocentri]|uniref:ABC transporter substrate-binding protein n=1 Tax=Hoeflea prorocentri TaxID=1922333 RepID=A0A9X3ZGN7_9HYPH|nr:ABC transporter substrate-binding protein [Hoeflea prorocentri]MCY6379996.1 ABC transporter substrate-binding protein [Hoeflea prorocentri]MDA5397796.1 ABC transporter substrate-binding protein [Hoeflea prorocentri]
MLIAKNQLNRDQQTFDRCRNALSAAGLAAAFALAGVIASAAAENVTVGQTFLASGLDPADGSTGWALVSHGIAEQLFSVSRDGEVIPNLAASATKNADGSWMIELSPERFFSDGTPVTAKLVAAALNRTGEANASARATAGRLIFEAVDNDTLNVTTEQPTAILPSILAEWAFPVYMETSGDPIFTGPFAVESFETGSAIEMVPNRHYEGHGQRPDVTIRRIADGQSMALAFASGELDLAFNLPVETISMFDGSKDRSVRSFPVAYQYMMWMNTRTPTLGDVRVRRAIDAAINRNHLVTAARAGTPATGAFAAGYPFAAEGTLAYDPDLSARLLDEAGWIMGDDGLRSKDGKNLDLVLWAYPQRPDLVTFQPVIRAALADLGIAVTTQVTESPSNVADSGEFDLFLWAQHTAPSGDPGLFLSLFFETDAARNYTGWSSATYDDVVDALRKAEDSNERIALAKKAQELIADGAPVSFLVTPQWHVGLSGRLADYQPWGSDYYVIRPDLFVSQP